MILSDGYRSKMLSWFSDINECEEALDNCSHVCGNDQGGFSCQCHSGYKLNEDNTNCTSDTGKYLYIWSNWKICFLSDIAIKCKYVIQIIINIIIWKYELLRNSLIKIISM